MSKKILFIFAIILLPLQLQAYEVTGDLAKGIHKSLGKVFGENCFSSQSACVVSVDFIICTPLPFMSAECISTFQDPDTGEIKVDRLAMGQEAYNILDSMRGLPEEDVCEGGGIGETCQLSQVKCTKTKKFLKMRYTCEYQLKR